MLIDWFTVGAQALNFLVLIWLLKRFLYKPVLDAIDAREKRIAQATAEAVAQTAQARREREELAGQRAAAQGEAAALLERAARESREVHERLLAAAHAEAAAVRTNQESDMQTKLTLLGRDITASVQQEVLAIARRVLADLADVPLEEQMARIFVRRLHDLTPSGRVPLEAALKTATDATVRTVRDMPEPLREAIRQALNAVLSRPVPLRFDTSPDPLCGVELSVGGQKLAWSVAEYLSTLDRKVGASLIPKTAAQPPRATGAAPVP